MKMRCWVCAVLGLILLQAYVRAADKPALPLVKKGTLVKVTESEIVVKSSDEKQGEVAYPRKEVSQHVKFSGEAEHENDADIKTRAKYGSPRQTRLEDLKPGSEVTVEWGASHLSSGGKVIEDGNYYQIKVSKFAKKE